MPYQRKHQIGGVAIGLSIIIGTLGTYMVTATPAYAAHPLPTFYPFSSANKSICYQMTALGTVKLDGQTNQATALKAQIEGGRQNVDSNTDINISVLSSCTSGSNQVSAQNYGSDRPFATTQVFNQGTSSQYKIIWYNNNAARNFSTSSICLSGDPNPQFVAVHEFGHFAGLDHPAWWLEPFIPSGHTAMKSQCSPDYSTIRPDDISQINGIY